MRLWPKWPSTPLEANPRAFDARASPLASILTIASSDFEDQVLSGLAPAAHVKKGLSGSQARNGACRSEGLERLVAGQHVPDRLGQLASEFDLGDFRAALAAEAAFGALVALLVERVRGGVDRCFHQPPAQISRAVLGQRA